LVISSPGILPDSASVVVVGGGVIGVSAAFHMAEAGVHGVVLIERGELSSGSSSRAAGGVRAQFSDPVNIALAKRSLDAYVDFARRPGEDIGLRQVGYLFLLTTEQDVAMFSRNIRLQNQLGVPSRLLSAEEAHRLCPLVDVSDVFAAAYSPDDGHATPEAVVHGYARGAREHGAKLLTGSSILSIDVRGGEIVAVRTTHGVIRTGTVICTAGAWSRAVGDMVGVELDVTPMRRQLIFTGPVEDMPDRLPMTIDFSTGLYFHQEGPGLLIGMPDPNALPGFATAYDDGWVPMIAEAIANRAPRLLSAGVRSGWAGLYEMTPDHNALIGEAESPSRFLYATGFSGHGFLQAPAVGEVLRDLYLRRHPFVDVAGLSARRYSEDTARVELNII
jgi:sarcosine oxidase subunit beta